MLKTLSIIVVNWNAGKLLIDCIKSIGTVTQSGFKISRVVVVDNNSMDNSSVGLENLGLPLTVIHNVVNRGFAAACNQGARDSKSDYLLFLNPDTRLFTDSLCRPIEFMEQPQNRQVGICGIKLVDEQGKMDRSCARFPTLRIVFGKVTRLYKLFPTMFPSHFLTERECAHSMEVDQISGAFFLVRKTLFDDLHGFDERFFVYYEDVDFSWRARQENYTSYFLSDVAAFHVGGGTSRQAKRTRLFYSLRSRILYALKNLTFMEKLLLISLIFSLELAARIVRSVTEFSASLFYETISAYGKLTTYLIGYFVTRLTKGKRRDFY